MRTEWHQFIFRTWTLLAHRHFDAFLTVDRNLSLQQQVPALEIAVVVLHAKTNRLADLQLLVPALLTALPTAKPGQVINIHP